LRPLFVAGIGLWSPGFPDLSAWLEGAPRPAAAAAPAELLPPALRRRATGLARMAAEVAGQAARPGALDLAAVPVVLGSAYGEIATAVEMMRSFREGEGMPSPTRFHNSVHNTPAAYLSIATGNRSFSTALAAGRDTTAMALLEASALLEERGGDALLVLLDEPAPAPFGPARSYPPAAVAFHLSVEPGAVARARLSDLRPGGGPGPELPGGLADHPCAGGFRLAAAVARGLRGTLALGGEGDGFSVELGEARA